MNAARPARPSSTSPRPAGEAPARVGNGSPNRRARRAAARAHQAERRLASWLRWPRLSTLLRRLLSRWLGAVLGAATLAFAAGPVYAQITAGTLPAGGVVITGSGQLQASPNLLTVRQSSDRLGIDWQSFSIGRDATVEFLQPGPGSIALNRVVGHEGSQIYGRLRANGQVFLTNPNGVLFAPGAKVDVGGLLASTLDMTQADFADGRFLLQAVAGKDGSVVNEGALAARAGGYLALFGQTVDNRGDLRVDTGSVVLASGRSATVSISGGGLISAVVTPGAAGSVLNSGHITADGGSVTMTAASAEALAQSLVNNSGIVRANTIEERGGEIWITGDRVTSSGTLQADASGSADAGRVVVKGGMETGSLALSGSISARAEAGKGGQVETSAAQVRIDGATRVATLAGSGQHGTWLIDPTNFTVSAGSDALTGSGIGATTLSANLEHTHVTLQTAPTGSEAGDLFVNAAVSWSQSTLLTLTAARHVEINADVVATGDAAGLAVNPGTGGTFTMATGARVRLPGANSTFSLGGTAYTMVRSLAELQAIDGSAAVLAGNYALADNLDASASATLGFSPIGNEGTTAYSTANSFRGRFQGLGNTISGLVVDLPASNATGLFAQLDNASVENLRLTGGRVNGSQMVGSLSGVIDGSTRVVNVHTDLDVNAFDDSGSGVWAGGLAGGSRPGSPTTVVVTRSSAAGHVTGDTATATANLGGLLGLLGRGNLSEVTASGNVTATLRAGSTNDSAFYLGGLIGFSSSTIDGASASGHISGGHESGGLVGRYTPVGGSITNASASGNVTSNGPAGGLVGAATSGGGAGGSITNSSASGHVTSTGSASSDGYAGGAVGIYNLSSPFGLTGSGNVTGVRAAGGVIGFLQTSAIALPAGSLVSIVPAGTTKTVTALYWAGGLVGYSNATGAADGLSFTGVVTTTGSTTDAAAGGLFGRSAGAITNSTSAGFVSGVLNVGGLVGVAAGTGGLADVSSSATVSASGSAGSVGGLAGHVAGGNVTRGSFTGSLSGGGTVGAVIGLHEGSGTLSALTTTVTAVSGTNWVGGLVGRTTGSIDGLSAAIAVTHTGTGDGAGGLAGYVGGSITNSSASGTVQGNNHVGGLVGHAAGSISGSSATGAVTQLDNTGYAGGLAGYVTGSGAITNVNATGNVTGGNQTGGLIGYFNSNGNINGASASGNVSAAAAGDSDAGGLIGLATGSGSLSNASASGTVSNATTGSGATGGLVGDFRLTGGLSNATASGNVSGRDSTGGLIGWLQSNATLTHDPDNGQSISYTGDSVAGRGDVGGLIGRSAGTAGVVGVSIAATITASAGNAGGLAGRLGGAVSDSHASGAVSGTGNVGGLIGQLEGGSAATVSGSTTSGAVTNTTTGGRTGGLIGEAFGGAISNSGASGAVSGGQSIGGLIGYGGNIAISNATVTATVTAPSTAGASVYAGGLAGRTAGAISNATASGDVTVSATGGTTYAGGLVGLAEGSNVAITGSSASGDVSVASLGGSSAAGGLVGYASNGDISGASASGSVSGGLYAGGLVGRYSPGTGSISGASASGNVSSLGDAGGLVGFASGAGSISDSSASGNVVSSATSTYSVGGAIGHTSKSGGVSGVSASGSVSGGVQLGGVIGNNVSGPLSGLTTTITSISGNSWVGGLVGSSSGGATLTGLVSAINVTHTGTSGGAGGVVGFVNGSVSGGSATGSVTATGTRGTVVLGGLAGEVDVGSVTSTSASGAVSGASIVGGLIGRFNPTGGSLLSGSSASGAVSGRVNVGGLVGEAIGTGGISNASATGVVVNTGLDSSGVHAGGAVGEYGLSIAPVGLSAAGNVSGSWIVGGVIGYLGSNVALPEGSLLSLVPEDTTKQVSGVRWVGGLVGYSNSTGAASTLTFAGTVTASGSAGAVGGLIGRSNGSVSDSVSTGTVTGGGIAGGLVGQANGSGGFDNVRSTATVSGGISVGGLVGEYANSGAMNTATASGTVSGGYNTGGLVGHFNSTGALTAATYTGSSVQAGVFSGGTVYLGGLLGYSRSASISDVNTSISVSNASTGTLYIGALAGRTGGAVSDAHASGNVSATGATGSVVAGGLIGEAAGSGALTDVSASGNVTVTSGSGGGSAGGLAGTATSGNISNAEASGNVTGQRYVGGLVGYYAPGTGTISASEASGDVVSLGDAGGLVGHASGTGSITGSTAAGDVTSSATSSYSAGGAVGYTSMTGGVTSVSAAGTVSGGVQTGGVVGYVGNSAAMLSGISTTGTSVSGFSTVGGLVGESLATSAVSGLSFTGTVTASGSGGSAGGLFGRSSGAIGNSSSAGSVSGGGNVGGLVGWATGSGGFTDVSSSATVSSDTTSGYVGGLVGHYNQGGTLLRGTASGAVTGGSRAGGLVGYAQTGTAGAGLEASSATGAVSSPSGAYVGGLVGHYQLPGAMSNVTASGDVVGGTNSTGGLVGYFQSTAAVSIATHTGESVTGGTYVGGLIGYSNAASISGASAVADVFTSTSATVYAGGLVGYAAGAGTTSDASATGDVSATTTWGSTSVGGLFGYSAHSSISASSASGSVTGGYHTGGLVGRYAPTTGSISDTVASGVVSGLGDVGGLVGNASGTGSITGSEAHGNVSSSSTVSYSAGGAVGYTSMSGGVTDVAVTGTVTGGYNTGGIVGALERTSAAFTGNSTTATTVTGYGRVGGLVGYSTAASIIGLSASLDVVHLGTGGAAGGLFGYFNGAISDSSSSGNVISGAGAGGLIGQAAGAGAKTGLSASGKVSSTGSGGVGGLIGEHSGGNLSDSHATGDVSGGSHTGGLIGYVNNAGSLNNASATGAVAGGSRTGGLVGYYYSSGNLSNATATGTVTGGSIAGGLVGDFYSGGNSLNLRAEGSVSATDTAGGLFGRWQYSGSLTDSLATGEVSASTAGGLVGSAYSNSGIVNGRASGEVRGSVSVGGLVGGSGYTSITRSQASGDVFASSASSWAYVGGLVGQYQQPSTGGGIFDSSASGTVTTDAYASYTGGLVGYVYAGSLERSGATGSVTAVDSGRAASTSHTAGGLIGYYSYTGTAVFADNAASGSVSAAGAAGGLVGQYYGSAVPTNVLASGNVTGRSQVGGLFGELAYVGVVNGSASGTVTNLTGNGSAGGLIGAMSAYAYDGDKIITDSRATGDVSGGQYAGGLIGQYVAGYYWYSSSRSSGIVASQASGNVAGAVVAGGLVGQYYDYGYYTDSGSDLGIRDSLATGNVQARQVAGGLVGQFYGYSGIDGSRATGNVAVDFGEFVNASAGGLVGEFQSYTSEGVTGRIARSTASGSVTLTTSVTSVWASYYTHRAGGLVGRLLGATADAVVVQDSYATGDVTVTSLGGTLYAGGLVGSTGTSLDRTYATGAVSATGSSASTTFAGGLVGRSESSGTTAGSSYWATDGTGQATSALGTASTLEAMRESATFVGWDIATTGGSDSVWRQYEGRSMPLLRNFLAPLTIVLTDVSRVYDGTTGLGIAPIVIGDVLVNNPSAITVFGDAVNVGDYTITGDNLTSSQGGYDLVLDGSATLTITPRPLTLTGVVLGKVYDGTTSATLAASPALGNLVAGEDLRFVPGTGFAAAFETRHAGVDKTVVLAGSYSITDGTVGRASNYQLPTGLTTTATITPKPVTVGSITAVDRVYDGSTVVAVNAAAGTIDGVIAGDTVAFDAASITSGTIPSKNVGTRPVTVTGAALTGADAGNYLIAGLDGITVQITPRQLVLNGLVATNRAYNANTAVGLSASGATLSGVIGDDTVLPVVDSLSGRTADRHVGDGKVVTVTGASLRGLDAANYTVVPGEVTVNITPYLLTVGLAHSGSSSRVYDGSTDAAVYFPTWYWYSVDDLTVSAASVGFADKNVAYDGSGNVVAKTITASGITISGADAGNYALQNTTATIAGTITPKTLAVSGVTAVDRVYDGTRDVQVDITSAVVDTGGLVAGDDVAVSTPPGGTVIGQVATKNAGTAKPVTVPGLALTGADARNYSITGSESGVTVDITRKDVTASYTGVDRVYDGSTYAQVLGTLDGVITGDVVQQYINTSCSYFCAYFIDAGGTPSGYTQNRHVGTDKPIVVTYNALHGTDAANYNLLNATGTATPADVTPKPVTLVFSGSSRVYDGTTATTVALNIGSSGLYAVDALTSTQTAVFTGSGAKNVGISKPIAVSDIAVSGAGAGNYVFLNTTATTTGAVTPKAVVVSGIAATNRAYDGTTTVAVTATETIGSTGFVDGDTVSITLPPEGLSTGTITTAGVGTAKPVTVTGLGLGGADAPNYLIDLSTSGITVNITPKALTPSFNVLDKVYDGGLSASVVSTTDGIIAGDVLTFAQIALFTGAGAKNVGTDKPVSITDIRLGGASAANYTLASTTASGTGTVTPKPVAALFTGGSRVYSGSTDLSAPVAGTSLGFVIGDAVGLSHNAVFTLDGNAGTAKPVSISDVLITGADAANYTLTGTTASTTATVTPRPLGVTGVTALSRVYDGTTTVSVNVSGASVDTSNVVPGDTVTIVLPPDGISTGSMSDRFVGSSKAVTISGASLGGSSSGNYVLVGATGLTVNITPRVLNATYGALDKVYDGTAVAGITASPADLLAIDAGGVGIVASGVFSGGKNVGDDKAVAISGGYLTGAFASNYTLANTSGSTTADITPRLLGLSYGSTSKVYDGLTTVDVVATLTGRIAGDLLSTTQTAAFTGAGAKNVGTAKPVAVSDIVLAGADAGNYRIEGDTRSTTGSITPRPITISGLSAVTAVDRVYDGSTTVGVVVPEGVTLTPGSSDLIAGDSVTIAVPGSGLTTGTMADKHVGDGKAVAITGLTLSGADAGNYLIAGTAGVTVNITPLAITATWLGVNRLYDGSTAAEASGSSAGVLDGDVLTIRGSGRFSDGKNVGTAKPITLTGGLLSGADARNYVLLNPTGSTSADVTPRPVTVGYSSPDKVYDGTATAPVLLAGSSGFVAGDLVGTTQTAVYTGGKNVGDGKAVAVTGIALTGADAANYSLLATSASTTGRITPRPLTLTGLAGITAVDREYDGTTAVAITVSGTGPIAIDPAGVIAGDDLAVNPISGGTTSGSMADKHAGVDKAVVVDGLALTGIDAGNYRVTATEGVTVTITPRALTASYAGVDKVYDGSDAAAVTGSSAGLLAGDSVLVGGSGRFTAGKNVGTDLGIEVTGGSLSGADAGNYRLVNTTGTATADITPKLLTASYGGGTRIYDGTVAAPVTGLLDGLIEGDAVLLTQTAVFTGDGAKNVGADKAVSISGISIDGADAGNYLLTGTSAVTTASITPRPLRIVGLTGVTAADRVYDGTREVLVTVSTSGPIEPEPGDLIAGDEVTLTAPPAGVTTGLMADKNVGENKPVAVTGLSIGGADAMNYTVAATSGVTVSITPKSLSASFIGDSRVYDGTALASAGGNSADIVAGDTVLIRGSGVFTGAGARNAGLNKPIDVTSAMLEGADAGNYRLLTTTGSTTADITPRPVTAHYTGVDREYDGSTAATVTRSLDGLIAGDTVSLSESASFSDSRHVGNDKPVQVLGITLAGADAGNYQLSSTTAATTASVTPRLLTVTGLDGLSATDRVYDGTLAVDVSFAGGGGSTGLAGVVTGDLVTLELPEGGLGGGLMLDKHAGTNKPVTLSGLALSGADAGNYLIGGIAGLTVNIAPREVTLGGVTAVDRVYDGSRTVAVDTSAATLTGAIAGDALSLLADTTGTMADKHVGVGKLVSVAGLALGGDDARNYVVIDSAPITVSITPRTLSPVFAGVDRVYDGSTLASVTITADGLVAGDALGFGSSAVFTGTGARNAGVDKPITVSALTLDGEDAGNYRLAFTTGSTTATIAPRLLTADATVAPRVYDGTVTAPATLLSSGMVAGDAVNLTGTATFTGAGAKNAGVDKPVSVSGLTLTGDDAGNYTLGGVSSLATTGTITPRALSVTVTALDKVYDGDTSATVTLADNRIAGDLLALTASGAAFDSADAGSGLRVVIGGLVLGGADRDNYRLPGTLPTAAATIRPAPLTITAGSFEKVYGEALVLPPGAFTAVGLVAGQTIGSVSLGSAGAAALADVVGSPYALMPSAASGGSFRAGNYDIRYVAGALVVLPRPVTVSSDLRLAFEDELAGLSYSATIAGLLPGSGHAVTGLTPPAPALDGVVGGRLVELRHSGGSISGTDPRNYVLVYEPGRLIVLPRPVRLDDAPEPGGDGGFGIVFSPEEVAAARQALDDALRALNTSTPADGPVGPGLRPPGEPGGLSATELAALFGSDTRQITLPALQKLPLISLDPALRRLLQAALTP